MKIVSVAEMRALEAAAVAAGITEAQLQARAGQVVGEEVLRLVGAGERVVILVGRGNNGRDGAVAAGTIVGGGVAVELVLAPQHALSGAELGELRERGVPATLGEDATAVSRALEGASLAVDALAGIGTMGALREPIAGLVRQLDASRGRIQVLALDLPSGVDADTGDVPGEAVWADSTVTLGGVKQGLLRFPAADHVGRLIPREIGLPPPADAALPYEVLDEADVAALVPPRPLDAHKYRFGRVLVIAGSDHFLGAPVLCAGAALRCGAGLVTVASTRDVRLNVAAHLPEATFTETDVRADSGPAGAAALEPYLRSHTCVVIGPGLGRSPSITAFLDDVLRLRPPEQPVVIDADGLVALAELDRWWQRVHPNTILTPHSGELERLIGHQLRAEEPMWVQASRYAQEWGCTLVAKGPFTCIAGPDGRVAVWPRANPALATGGTGDVLAGLAAGAVAQGLASWDAARLAVGIHGLAGQRVTGARNWRTLLASDLFEEIPAAMRAAIRPR
jgi:NAD(P)H-hydrate epimerase